MINKESHYYQKFKQIAREINAVHLYKRIALFLSILFFIYFMWQTFLYKPAQSAIKIKQSQLISVQKETEKTQKKIMAMQDKILEYQNKEASFGKKQSNLLAQSKTLDEKLKEIHRNLISYDKISTLLKDLIKRQKKLQLISLDVLPKEIVGSHEFPMVYQHEMKLVLIGDYMGLFQYFKSLDKLDWPLFWDKLDYQVTQYPKAKIMVELHTLSAEKANHDKK